MPESVVAVVVTYNRCRLLLECLKPLMSQTRPLERIVLIDNASTDETVATLTSLGLLDNPLISYTRLPHNLGGAGGFEEGVRQAMNLNADWIWIMDDDAEVYENALERLLAPGVDGNFAALANLVLGEDGEPQLEHRGWLSVCGLTARAHRAIGPRELTAPSEISFCSFVGLAVRSSTVRQIGLPNRELFIKGDDLEYCLRVARVGPIRLVPDSLIRHKDGGNAHFEQRRSAGLQSRRVPIQRLWLSYFSVRNLVWIRRVHCGLPLAVAWGAYQMIRHAAGILVFDDVKWTRLRFFGSAILDGLRGVFDNEKPRRLTRLQAPRMNRPAGQQE